MDGTNLKYIAKIHTDFPSKFGIPRQSGLKDNIARIVMEPEYRRVEAFRGLEGYSHIWVLWDFSENHRDSWSPTVRPPRLGGNERMGVFATRSPFRPNPIGMSSLKLIKIDYDCADAPVLIVSGADMMNLTPIFDIKPYIQADVHTDAKEGFSAAVKQHFLKVEFKAEIPKELSENQLSALTGALSEDPRPSYQHDEKRVYGMNFAKWDVKFTVENNVLTVVEFDNLIS
jgi:tRNA (adenine37-N6)-methyltransferase